MALFCDHNRLADHCEDCAFVSALERGVVPPDGKARDTNTPPRVTVDVDTVIDRSADLGPGRETFVAAGDAIPVGLENHTRSARGSTDNPKPARTRRT